MALLLHRAAITRAQQLLRWATGDRARVQWAEKEAVVPLSERGTGFPSNTVSPGPRPTSIPSGTLIHSTVWPQYTKVTDRQDRQDNCPVAYCEPLLVTVVQKL